MFFERPPTRNLRLESPDRVARRPSSSSSRIDHITIPSKEGRGDLKRVDEVFDCWFESGSMPYAQVHYPFEVNEEEFLKERFPADFVAEGLDQVRA